MQKKITKIISLILCFLLMFEQGSFAQTIGQLDILGYLSSLRGALTQDKFRPLHLRYLFYDTTHNNFRLLLDKGDLKDFKVSQIQETTQKLLEYFFVGISLPNDSFWVNLRPDSPDNIIDPYLAQTDVGKIFLEADLQLKKDTAKFTSPENPKGKEYWEKLYKKAGELFGYSNITIPTLTRPWIVPDEIIVREAHDNAYIYKATLKVQLEQDHLKGSAIYNFDDHRLKELNDYSSQIIRELIIPELTKEINISKRYAPLRQVYYSLILAQWFKQKFSSKGGFYSGLIDRRNLNGITSKEDWSKTTYFKEYQKSFKDGEYNVKEPVYTPFGQTIRSYFSGGVDFGVGQQGQRSGAIANAIQKGLIRGNIAQETLAANSHIVAVDIGKGGGLENLGVDKRFIQLGKVSSPISADDKEYIENIEKMLVFSKRFGVGKARRYVQIMASGIRNVEVNGRLNENQLKRVLYLTSRSYELAARYLAGLIRRIKGSQPVWSLPLLENINLDLDEKVAKADYLFASLSDDIANGPKDMQELEDRVLLADRTQFNKHKWFRLDDNVTSWNKQDMKTPFIVADDETTSALESMIKQGFVVEDYFNSQPIYRQSDLLPDSEDIRFVCFLEDGFAIRKYISKRRSKLQEGKLETALDEFTITVEIKKRLGRQEIKMDEFLKPVLVDIAQPRAFINTGKETFMLTDFVEGTMMDDFLSGKTENERKPYITLFKKLFQKLFEEGIVWGSPYLRNIVISNEDGQVKLTLLDWENSLLPVGVVSDGLKRECMIQAWRKAAVLTAKERLSITSDYFSGPGTLDVPTQDKQSRAIVGTEVNFGRMITMDSDLREEQITNDMNNRFLKERIALFETDYIDTEAGRIPYLYIEHQLRDWYTIHHENKEVFYDLLYSAYKQNLCYRIIPLIWRILQVDLVSREIKNRKLYTLAGREADGPLDSSLIEFIKFLWEMDAEGYLEQSLNWVDGNFDKLFSSSAVKDVNQTRLRKDFLSGIGVLPSDLKNYSMTQENSKKLIQNLTRKIGRYRPDLVGPWSEDFLVTVDPQVNQMNIVYNGGFKEAAAAEYYKVIKEQVQKFFQISSGSEYGLWNINILPVSHEEIQSKEARAIVPSVGETYEPVIIDGEEGGGQMIRNALALSAIFGRSFFLKNTRTNRDMPGLRTTHVGAINLVKAFTGAKTSPYERDSTNLYFKPSHISAKDSELDLDRISKGSPSLVSSIVQAILPVMLFGDKPSTVVMKGGTNLPNDLSTIYIKEILLPFLRRYFGIDASLEIIKYGWSGGGQIILKTQPVSGNIPGLELRKRGAIKGLELNIQVSNPRGEDINKFEELKARLIAKLRQYNVPVTVVINDVTQQSSTHAAAEVLLKSQFEEITVGFSNTANLKDTGDLCSTIDSIIGKLSNELDGYIQSGAVMDKYLADMVMLYSVFAEGKSVYSTAEVTDHLLWGAEVINRFMPDGKRVIINGEKGKFGTVVVDGVGLKSDREKHLEEYALSYGFFRNVNLLKKWIKGWGELMGISDEEVLERMGRNDNYHSFTRAMVTPDELWIYLLPLLKEAKKTKMRPVFIKRAAGIFQNAYNALAEAVEGFYDTGVLSADSILVSRLEKSGIDRTHFFNNFRDPPSTAKTTIFSPTVNHLLSLEEADSVLPDEELSQLSNLYNKMTQNEREALDRYLKDIWELDEGFNTLLHGKKKRKEWVRYLADWRVDSRYYIYMYNQKTKIPWDADFSGLGHKKLIDILDKAFNGQLSINVENFLSNLKTALIDINCADLATLVDNRGLNLQAHLFRIADESGRLHKHQAKILFKVLRVLVAAQADFKSMRHNLTHGARPFLNIILRNTGFAEEAKQGMIFVDEVTNGGENILYLEIVCKAFNPGFQYRFLDLSQIHPELSKLYLGLGIVDDVLAPQALHPLEDFPEMAEEQYTLDAESPTLQKFRYKTVLEELKASVAKRGRDLQQVIGERDLEIDKVLSDQPLRALLTEMQNLESYRKVANFDIGRELVKNYIRVKGNGANFIDGLVFPNVFFCGIAGFSNREYEVLDKEWDLITKFRTRLSELENEKHDLVVKINYLDNEAKIADYISYLSLWCDWYERTLSEIKDTKKEIIARADTIREFMEGRIDNGSLVRELMESAYDSKDKEYLPFGDFVQRYTGEYIGLLGKQSDKESLAMLVKLASLIIESHRKGGRLFIIGNGEGAAIASHMTADFGKGVAVQGSQGRLSAVSLSSLPWISALANDVSFASIYEEQLKNHNLGENDIIIAVEGSQKLSSEIRNALKYAAKVGSKKILLAAASLNAPDVSCADMAIQIKSGTRSQVENIFLTVNHVLVEILRSNLNTEKGSTQLEEKISDETKSYYAKLRVAVELTSFSEIGELVSLVKKAVLERRNIFVFGNGGHVATASHVAYKLKTMVNELGLKSGVIFSLTENLTDITGVANKSSYNDVFISQLRPIIREGDLVIGISTSGDSENVVRAMKFAYSHGANIVGFCGFSGGRIKGMPRHFYVPNADTKNDYGRTEDIFILSLNMILDLVKANIQAEQDAILEQQINRQFGIEIEEILKNRGVGTNPGRWVNLPQGYFYIKGAWEDPIKLGEDQLRMEYIASTIYRKLGFHFPETNLIRIGKHLVLASKYIPGVVVQNDPSIFQKDPEIVYGFLIDCYLGNRNSAYPKNLLITEKGSLCRLDAGGSLTSTSRGNIKVFRSEVDNELEYFRNAEINPWGAKLFAHVNENTIREAVFGTQDYLGVAALTDEDIEQIVKLAGFEESTGYLIIKLKEIETAMESCKDEKDRASLLEARDTLNEVIKVGGFEPYLARRLKERRDWLVAEYSKPRAQRQGLNAETEPTVSSPIKQGGLSYFAARGTWNKDLIKEKLYGDVLEVKLPSGALVLDVGCGVGYLTMELKRRGFNSIGLDISSDILDEAKRIAKRAGVAGISYIQGSAVAMPFADHSMDAITITNVLEHVSDEEAILFLKEAKRVLKDDGYVLIGIPVKTPVSMLKFALRMVFDPYMRKNRRTLVDDTGDITHKVWYTDKKLFRFLKKAGFQLEKPDYFIYRTAEWPRGRLIHGLQDMLDKYDSHNKIKRLIAFGMYAIAKKIDNENSVNKNVPVIAQNNGDENRNTDSGKGGIDFHTLPIINQPVNMPAANLIAMPMKQLDNVNLDSEWIEIQNMLNAGIIPSTQRIKEYALACCEKRELHKEINKILGCIADIMRIEEERSSPTDLELKDLLVLVESGKSINETELGLNSVSISSKEPVSPQN